MCYVGKATKIFIFIVAVAVVAGLILAFGLFRRGASHQSRRQCSPEDESCYSPPAPAAVFANPNPATPSSPGSSSSPISAQPSPPTPDSGNQPPPFSPPSAPPPAQETASPPPPLQPLPISPPPPNAPAITGAPPPSSLNPPSGTVLVAPGPVHA
ncbi:unnamed protein product [Linum tenue]|uniref:Uncharacterized protein n=1 Tax=Linum tenue TaxID=586396 RepID=A0AAV0R1L1_9ROSI|nr:unnamed protein product [Linum tenue]CAI0550471.1 unnamed protein product [Linum tenue]